MRPLLVKYALLPLFVLASLIMYSCTSDDQRSSITPTDLSASTLTVTITANEDENLLYVKSQVSMRFSSNQIINPTPIPVDFKNEATLTCNGKVFTFDGTSYTATVATDQNGEYNCIYIWKGTSISIPTHQQTSLFPTLDPQAPGKVTVSYNSNGGYGCQFKVDASDGAHSVTKTSLQDTGSIRDIDISALSGPGTWTLTRTCTLTSNTAGFILVSGTYTATKTTNITWNSAS